MQNNILHKDSLMLWYMAAVAAPSWKDTCSKLTRHPVQPGSQDVQPRVHLKIAGAAISK